MITWLEDWPHLTGLVTFSCVDFSSVITSAGGPFLTLQSISETVAEKET